ncbi:pyridoxal phosphate-dependent transferase [Aspergillus heterothallicus]
MQSTTFPPSDRASATLQQGPAWNLMQQVKRRPRYDPESRPDGLINLSGAINNLMADWMSKHAQDLLQFTTSELSYGPLAGSHELLEAAAGFFNRFFNAADPVLADHVLAANGVTSLINMMAWVLCDSGDGILYTTPNFYMLDYDLGVRNDIVTIPVSTTSIECPFDAAGLIPVLESALQSHGDVSCRILFLCNPSNPQGGCYSTETLEALAAWCAERKMHLVVDEIYAMSTFDDTSFSSTLTIPARQNVHCLYGLSKDFNMGGVRVSFLVSRNPQIRAAVSKLTWFSWLTVFSDVFVSRFLSQLDLVQGYLDTYRPRLAEAYHRTVAALDRYNIPFQQASGGLFIFIDLHGWIHHFADSQLSHDDQAEKPTPSPEIQLCEWLIEHGVFLNAGQFAGHDRAGCFRLVFTQDPGATELAIQQIRAAIDELDVEKRLDA